LAIRSVRSVHFAGYAFVVFGRFKTLGSAVMRTQPGFTLIELVVVIMIIGILAAVAAPKLISTSGAASDNAAKQSLNVIRDAIERYAADNGGAIPAIATLTNTTFTSKYLRGSFPKCPVGAKKGDATIKTSAVSPPLPEATPTAGWMYNSSSGEFIINSSAAAVDGTIYGNM
jgi:general secretion pathway protein G